jgi:hypothetical protein
MLTRLLTALFLLHFRVLGWWNRTGEPSRQKHARRLAMATCECGDPKSIDEPQCNACERFDLEKAW